MPIRSSSHLHEAFFINILINLVILLLRKSIFNFGDKKNSFHNKQPDEKKFHHYLKLNNLIYLHLKKYNTFI
jgi:hypothetical protein